MAYSNLLNNLCTWRRQGYAESSQNEFNEQMEDPDVVASDVKCRLEKLYDRELVEAFGGGDHDKGIYVLYLPINQDIRASDLVTLAETVKLGGFGTTTVDGVYKRTTTLLNDKSTYDHIENNYQIFFDGDVWVIKDIENDLVMYTTQGSELGTKLWVADQGAEPVGKSVFYKVADFHYNNKNKPNELVVNDVEDAGGGHRHHLQCFCRYREEIQ